MLRVQASFFFLTRVPLQYLVHWVNQSLILFCSHKHITQPHILSCLMTVWSSSLFFPTSYNKLVESSNLSVSNLNLHEITSVVIAKGPPTHKTESSIQFNIQSVVSNIYLTVGAQFIELKSNGVVIHWEGNKCLRIIA